MAKNDYIDEELLQQMLEKGEVDFTDISDFTQLRTTGMAAMMGIAHVLQHDYMLPKGAVDNIIVGVRNLTMAYAANYAKLMAQGKVPEEAVLKPLGRTEHWIGTKPEEPNDA